VWGFPGKLTSVIRRHGVAGTAGLVVRRVDERFQFIAHQRRERRFDREMGLETGGRIDHPEALAQLPEFEHAIGYEGTTPRRFRRLMKALPIERSQFTFVDLGCGKGKALLMAADLGFGRLVGIEFSPELAAAARENVAGRRELGPATAEVVTGDAGAYEFPPGPLVIYMYNPFRAVIMAGVVANIERTLAARPRPLFVVYLQPFHPGPLDASGALRRVPLPPEVLSPPPARGLLGRLRFEIADDLAAIVYEADGTTTPLTSAM
jgi:SAM-dependent methyltransferase